MTHLTVPDHTSGAVQLRVIRDYDLGDSDYGLPPTNRIVVDFYDPRTGQIQYKAVAFDPRDGDERWMADHLVHVLRPVLLEAVEAVLRG